MEKPSGGEKKAAWRTCLQRKYTRQLISVLRRRRIERETSGLARSRTVKLAADLSLAMMARGRTAWSRAILQKCLFRLNNSRCQRRPVLKSRMNSGRSVSAKNSRPYKTAYGGKKFVKRLFGAPSPTVRSHGSEPARSTVASRVQTLRELVPGSRGLDLPVFLQETGDYIEALQMQVRAMQALTDRYSSICADTCKV